MKPRARIYFKNVLFNAQTVCTVSMFQFCIAYKYKVGLIIFFLMNAIFTPPIPSSSLYSGICWLPSLQRDYFPLYNLKIFCRILQIWDDANILPLQMFVLQQLWKWYPASNIPLSFIPFTFNGNLPSGRAVTSLWA